MSSFSNVCFGARARVDCNNVRWLCQRERRVVCVVVCCVAVEKDLSNENGRSVDSISTRDLLNFVMIFVDNNLQTSSGKSC